jgi:leucyl aminopeptidase
MTEVLLSADQEDAAAAIPVDLVRPDALEALQARRGKTLAQRIAGQEFKAKAGQMLVVHRADGRPERALFGLGESGAGDAMALRGLAARLPAGTWRIASAPPKLPMTEAATAFALGSYVFDRYRKAADKPRARLVAPKGCDLPEARRIAHACALARDMVNTPANDMGPLQIETIAREIAGQYGAQITVVTGDALLDAGYPAVHAVGRAASPARAPRMIELAWGEEGPLVAIVGKGVVFDSGGLDIKPASGMRLMKKDMGGAAHALALARMVMDAGLKVRLAVLVPAVENAISGDAMRPGDVIASRKGLSIEIGNTDAEGRLILADALARAAELGPELTIDMATLTGAARVALGPQVIPAYTADDAIWRELEAASARTADPLWRMPLWQGYAEATESDIADLRNDGEAWAQAGSIMAALFLQRFAPPSGWVHLDIFAWNPKGRPGWPTGAEAQAVRALYAWLKGRYA